MARHRMCSSSKLYYRPSVLFVKYNISLTNSSATNISEPVFNGDLVYKFKRNVGKPSFSDKFNLKKLIKRYKRVLYISGCMSGCEPNLGL